MSQKSDVHEELLILFWCKFILCRSLYYVDLYNWLTVHRTITLVNFQLDAQNSL